MVYENKNNFVLYWLLLITLLVALMIIVGGLTRLTDSGLSITKWDLFVGIIPPLSNSKWEEYFLLYKSIPEFKLINYSMTLEEFKVIFWWEYIHRLLGRLIGLIYLIPLLYFTFKKNINKRSLISFYFIFFLICFQGFLGWYMVTSGLIDRTDVSHYRLSLHLLVAFIIFVLLLWNFLKYQNSFYKTSDTKLPYNIPLIFLSLIILQISLGALVSGLDAGKIYQTWPLMNYSYFPDDSSFYELISFKFFESPSLLQFAHRNLAYFIFIFFILILILVFNSVKYKSFRKITIYIFLAIFIQMVLGIMTILSGANIYLASLHQIGSIFLITTAVIFLYKNYKLTNGF